MWKYFTKGFSLLLGVLSVQSAVAGHIPDFYQEPGVNPKRQYSVDLQGVENIDPFTGILRLSYDDLVIPGNGGLDIVVKRTYHLAQQISGVVGTIPYKNGRTVTGLGWDIHFGRIRYAGALFPNGCGEVNQASSANPVLELPDGTRKVLFNKLTGSASSEYITKDRWTATCIDIAIGQYRDGGLLVTSPDGTKYTMNLLENYRGLAYPDDAYNAAWHTTRIEDKNGNWIKIDYVDKGTTQYANIDRITSSDGRRVDFTYTNPTTNDALLTRITANGQSWDYSYSAVPNDATGYYFLDSVTGPEGLTWKYDYYATGVGLYSLSRMSMPYGGTVDYTYQQRVALESVVGGVLTTAIKTKKTAGPGVVAGTWTYAFSTASNDLDETTITTPNGKEVFFHCGEKVAFIGSRPTECSTDIGKLLIKEIFYGTTRIQTEQYGWTSVKISDQIERYPTRAYGIVGVFTDVLTQKIIRRNNTTFSTTYSNFDSYDNPGRIDESSGGDTRRTDYTYYADTSKWIVKQVKDETLFDNVGQKVISRTFDANGRLAKEDRYGELTQYTYTAEGDIDRITDPRSNSIRYSSYKRGIPQTETYPESVVIRRTVNDTGTVATETNGRGNKTSYQYDALNRLTVIIPPAGSRTNMSYSWRTKSRTTTRGTFSQRNDYDGFGRVVKSSAEGITVDSSYNALGQKIFESNPNSTKGARYDIDILGRVEKITNTADNTSVSFFYSSNNRVIVIDENNSASTYKYQSYGSPEEKYLLSVSQPENINTTITRTRRGDVLSIQQGGLTRSFTYDSRYFLDYIDHPEIGRVDVNYDGNGNMISRSTGASAITRFTYDGLNRLTRVNYPGTTPDVNYSYNANNNLESLTKGDTSWAYSYDGNDNLTSEKLAVGNKIFDIGYSFNSLDALTQTTFPNGLAVAYAPNALGQSTQAGAFASRINYHPNGQVSDLQFGNGKSQSISQNPRLFVGDISTAGIANISYTYDNAGNPLTIKDSLNSAYDLSLTYDGVNRLKTADGAWSTGAFAYNDRGDIISKRLGTDTLNYNYSGTSGLLTGTSGIKSYGFNYDVYGNVIANGFDSFIYDDASNLIDVTSQNKQYIYDGHNRRVAEVVNGRNHYYVYNTAGQLLYETDAFDVKQTSYIRLGSMLIAQQDVCLDGDQDLDLIPDCVEVEAGLNPQDPGDADKDLDGDGLSNLVEYQLGTSIANSDTDGDLMSDGFENKFGLDPFIDDAALDLDGDGFTNLEEFQRSSNPADASSIPAGGTRWSVELNTDVVGMVAAQDGSLYFSLNSSADGAPPVPIPGSISSQLTALSADGSIKWTHDFIAAAPYYAISQPVIGFDGSIYIVFTDLSSGVGASTLYSMSQQGAINWSVIMGESSFSITPVIGSDGTIYTAADRHILAYDNLGVLRWSAALPSLVMDNLALSSDDTLYAFADNATVTGNCSAVMNSPLIDNRNLVELIDSNLFAINANGSLKWHRKIDAFSSQPPAIGIDGTLYYMQIYPDSGNFNTEGALFAVSRNGDLLWTKGNIWSCGECGGGEISAPVIAQDGSLIVRGSETHMINPDGSTKWAVGSSFKADGSYLDFGESIGASAIVTKDNNLYAGTTNNLILYDKNGRRLWVSPSVAISTMLLSPVNDQLYVNESSLYANSSGPRLKAIATNGVGLSQSAWPMEGQNIGRHASAKTCALADGDNDGDGIPACAENSIGLDDNNAADASADPDADGLSNLQEYQSKTHYLLPDTDFDGLVDGIEVSQLFDPADADMDDDGLTDGFETANGLDPQLADADQDNDNDGFSNIEEFVAGKNPADTASKPLEGDELRRQVMPFLEEAVFGHDGTLYYTSPCGMHAVAPDGRQKWIYPTKTNYEIFWPMVGPDGTIYSYSSFARQSADLPNLFNAINTDGSLKWEKGMSLFFPKAVGVNGMVYVIGSDSTNQNTLFAINPDGTYQWTYTFIRQDFSLDVRNLIVGADGSIYVSTRIEDIAFTFDGKVKWQRPVVGNYHMSTIGPNGNIYYTSGNSLNAINPDTGLLLWAYSHPNYTGLGEITVAADDIVTVTTNGGDMLQISGSGDLIRLLDISRSDMSGRRTETESGGFVFNERSPLRKKIVTYTSSTNSFAEILLVTDDRYSIVSPTAVSQQRLYSVYDGKLHVYNTSSILATGGWPMGGHDLQRTNSLAAGLPPPFNNSSPTLVLNSPADGATVIEGNPVNLNATASDILDGDLSAVISWVSSLDGDLGTGADIQVNLSLGNHLITATVIDSDFLTTRVELTVNVNASLDIDGDDMLDQWEIDTFGSLDELPTGDFNGDGISNFQEYKNYIILTFGGDVNQDGASNVADVVLLQQYLLGSATLNTQQILRGDYYPATGDNTITISDLLILQQRVLSVGN